MDTRIRKPGGTGRLFLKPLDWVVVFLALVLTVFSGVSAYRTPKSATRVLIRGSGGTWVYPQNAEETVAVSGPLGDTVVELRQGRARVLSSPCGNKTCIAAGHIRARGQWIACLPNKVFVLIEGTTDENGPIDTLVF
ncbi:MAG: NusG domain II-containing protein [Spirochaetaceae bacterium]|jgi:hypothetical protein|nr:NusG domain II-containing protein [Spirochaetaceae bacterium]